MCVVKLVPVLLMEHLDFEDSFWKLFIENTCMCAMCWGCLGLAFWLVVVRAS